MSRKSLVWITARLGLGLTFLKGRIIILRKIRRDTLKGCNKPKITPWEGKIDMDGPL